MGEGREIRPAWDAEVSADQLRRSTLEYIGSMAYAADAPGRYLYSASTSRPTLYASAYAAMTRDLHGELATVPPANRREWASYLQSHQDVDGLFRDPVIFGRGMYAGDPLWCGRAHLTHHVITALCCLDAQPLLPLRWLDQFKGANVIEEWLQEREWETRVAWVGNEVMNVGSLLQYVRDWQRDEEAGEVVARMLDWLAAHVRADIGMWGTLDAGDALRRSHLVQAAYHIWPLFGFDGRPIPHRGEAVDVVLATENERSGFGWGEHNTNAPFWSSACEDIDSIEPLVRYGLATEVGWGRVAATLTRARQAVLQNRNPDGGFVFARNLPAVVEGQLSDWYPDESLQAAHDQSEMFSTWFRTLSIALIDRALDEDAADWHFCQAPGMQFWGEPGVRRDASVGE